MLSLHSLPFVEFFQKISLFNSVQRQELLHLLTGPFLCCEALDDGLEHGPREHTQDVLVVSCFGREKKLRDVLQVAFLH